MKQQKRSPFESANEDSPTPQRQATDADLTDPERPLANGRGAAVQVTKGSRLPMRAKLFAAFLGSAMLLGFIFMMSVLGVTAMWLGIATALAAVGMMTLGFSLSSTLTHGVVKTKEIAEGIARGELNQRIDIKGNDEIGDLAEALSRMVAYLQGMAEAAKQVAEGDLTATVRPVSERDTLGNAFAMMVDSLRRSVGEIREKLQYLNEIPTPVFTIDKEFNIKYVNPACASVVGRSPEDCVGQKCFSLLYSNHCNTRNCQGARAMQMDRIITDDAIASLPFGDLPMRFTGAPLKNEDGTIVGALEYAVDVTKEVDAVNTILWLVEGAANGDLRPRADIEQYEGNFRKMIEGVNQALDAVVRPLDEATAVLQKVSRSDLTMRMESDSQGDYAKLKKGVNASVDHLTGLVSKIKTSADSLARASDQLAIAASQASEATQQVASTSQEMARGAGEQAGGAQETAKAVEQLSAVIEDISNGAQEQANGFQRASASIGEVSEASEYVAQNAAIATQGAKDAAEAARNGAELTMKTVTGMETIMTTVEMAAAKVADLGERSSEIGKIVAVIDDIAAQTNLLALNAAIEAARAGEQGRGFAVVSDEVRKLAERTGTATKEIAGLVRNVQAGVDESVKAMEAGSTQVKEGYQLASSSGEALENVQKAVTDVSDLIERISTLAQHVSASASDLFKIIESVGHVTEQNTKASREMSSSASIVAKSIDSVAMIAEQTSTSTQEVSATAEEMNAQVEEMVASSESLRSMAEGLLDVVIDFSLSSASTPVPQRGSDHEEQPTYYGVDGPGTSTPPPEEVPSPEMNPTVPGGDQEDGY
jgi:methyl-accepting chemotaxis protein